MLRSREPRHDMIRPRSRLDQIHKSSVRAFVQGECVNKEACKGNQGQMESQEDNLN